MGTLFYESNFRFNRSMQKFVLLCALLSALLALSTASRAAVMQQVYGLPSLEYAQKMEAAIMAHPDANKEHPEYNRTAPGAWHCPTQKPSASSPTSVHSLRAVDIGVVGALGDSITAAFGAKSTNLFNFENWLEYRGISWSVGGDDTAAKVLTVPNMLKNYNPAVTGFSVGTTQNKEGPLDFDHAKLDGALSGARVDDLPRFTRDGYNGEAYNWTQAAKKLLTADQFQNEWKLITIFIGGNNQCWACHCENCNYTRHEPAKIITEMEEALDYLQANVPKVLVALVLPVDVTSLTGIAKGLCSNVLNWACPCAATKNQDFLKTVQATTAAYIEGFKALAQKAKYEDDDFTVVAQPFLTKTLIPKKSNGNYDMSYLAPDCFHFSAKAHAAAATGLWDNLFEPFEKKDTAWRPGDKARCPSDNQLICTDSNVGRGGC